MIFKNNLIRKNLICYNKDRLNIIGMILPNLRSLESLKVEVMMILEEEIIEYIFYLLSKATICIKIIRLLTCSKKTQRR